MRNLIAVTCMYVLILASISNAQKEVINIWKGKIPDSIENKNYKEEDLSNAEGIYQIRRVKVPTLSIFLRPKENSDGTAVVICPGGGYMHLAFTKEGIEVAKWLNSIGVAAFVLKYRLPSDQIMKDKTIGPLQDAQEAMRIVRRKAKEWNIDPNKIGIMGFSAGGHLAATLCTHYNAKVYDSDTTSAKPDFSILLYPVISMKPGITHYGSMESLLGKNPTKEKIDWFSNELQVNKNTPPAFLALAGDDNVVPIQNSIDYFLALKKYKIPGELHIFNQGGHGFGLGKKGTTQSNWSLLCKAWMKVMGFL